MSIGRAYKLQNTSPQHNWTVKLGVSF